MCVLDRESERDCVGLKEKRRRRVVCFEDEREVVVLFERES